MDCRGNTKASTALQSGTLGKKKLSYKIERVQRAAARYILNDYDYTSSVTELLKVLNWKTLEYRRIQNSLVLPYKIKSNLVAVDHHHLTEIRNLFFLYTIFTDSVPHELVLP